MNRKGFFIGALVLAAAIVAPLASTVGATPQVVVRFYARDHHDYHNWDDNEARYYETYRHDHHEYNVEFRRTSRAQQREYWRWRHEHHD
jgi:hypothetical protein